MARAAGSMSYPYGGVVAIEVSGDLTIQSYIGLVAGANNVDVGGGGLLGGVGSRASNAGTQTGYRYPISTVGAHTDSPYAGNKGEGVAGIQNAWGAGRCKAFNGGGGGRLRHGAPRPDVLRGAGRVCGRLDDAQASRSTASASTARPTRPLVPRTLAPERLRPRSTYTETM